MLVLGEVRRPVYQISPSPRVPAVDVAEARPVDLEVVRLPAAAATGMVVDAEGGSERELREEDSMHHAARGNEWAGGALKRETGDNDRRNIPRKTDGFYWSAGTKKQSTCSIT